MIRSMTGFGKAEVTIRKRRYRIEISGLNNRFREISFRLPKVFADRENRLREVVAEQASRGKITVVVSQTDSEVAPEDLILNDGIAEIYYRMFSKLQKKFALKGQIEVNHFVGLPDLFGVAPAAEATPAELKKLISGLRQALRSFNGMREAEGRALAADMSDRVKSISFAVDRVEKLQPQSLQLYRKRLEKHIRELTGDSIMQPAHADQARLRIDMEVTLMADRVDVTEECVRLKSHCQAFAKAIRSRGDAGKRLGFILQELNREANTIGSKAILYDISVEVINIKEETEKLREQVQNIE